MSDTQLTVPCLFAIVYVVCLCFSDVVTVFKRTLNSKGVSAYHVDGRRVEFGRYKEQLEDIGIWIEAKNFLVFQVRTTHLQHPALRES